MELHDYPDLSQDDAFLVLIHGINLERELMYIDLAMHELVLSRVQRSPSDVWYHLQALLSAAAKVSKTLWPIRSQHKARGELLRSAFKVSDDSPFRNRKVRDTFEHFDEQLDRYLWAGGQVVFDSHIGPRGLVRDERVPQLRGFDPDGGIVSFLDEEIALSPLFQAVAPLRLSLRGVTYMLDADLGPLKPAATGPPSRRRS